MKLYAIIKKTVNDSEIHFILKSNPAMITDNTLTVYVDNPGQYCDIINQAEIQVRKMTGMDAYFAG